MSSRALLLAVLCATAAPGVVSTAAAQNRASNAGQWEVPRTPDGHPDLQGNWTNQSMTPFQRPEGQGPVYTPEEVAEIEQGYVDRTVRGAQPSNPDRPPPPPKETISAVDSYNDVFFERGSQVAVVYGEPRTSLITFPSNGRLPALSPEGERRRQERRDGRSNFGQYDHPELRPLAERCLTSYGSPAGPPMIPNGGYNSNYTIVQTPDPPSPAAILLSRYEGDRAIQPDEGGCHPLRVHGRRPVDLLGVMGRSDPDDGDARPALRVRLSGGQLRALGRFERCALSGEDGSAGDERL